MTALHLLKLPQAWRAGARVALAFPVTAGVFLLVTAAPIIVSSDLSEPARTAFSLHSLSLDAEVLCWIYLWILGLVVAFGLPTWLVLRGRAWGGAVAYALVAAVAANLCFFAAQAWLAAPVKSTPVFAIWSAAAGAFSGLVFHWIACGRTGRRVQ